MIVSDKPDQSTSGGRGSGAGVSRHGFLKRLTAGGGGAGRTHIRPPSALGLGETVAPVEAGEMTREEAGEKLTAYRRRLGRGR